jgi:hypothetical protein
MAVRNHHADRTKNLLSTKVVIKICRPAAVAQLLQFAFWLKATEFSSESPNERMLVQLLTIHHYTQF